MSICVIGAGISGLSCISELSSNNLEFDCFEKRNSLGGIWNYSDIEDSVYLSCRQNHPQQSMAINDVPINLVDKDYLGHSEYLTYLQQFDSPNIHYGHSVECAKYDDSLQSWVVTVNKKTKYYSHLVVCSGHYTSPYVPELYHQFKGKLLHSKAYKKPESFSGERVLVVGGGNSGMQIASDLVGHAKEVNLSIRSMPYIMPRYIDGEILSDFYQKIKHLPECEIVEILKQHGVDQTRYKIRKPEQGLLTGSTIPTCDEIFTHANSDHIQILQSVSDIEGKTIRFPNAKIDFDTVIIATGYRLSFPFLDFNVDYHDNQDFIISKRYPKLFFVGMVQPIGPVPPLLRAQSMLISKLIASNDFVLPDSNFWAGKSHRLVLDEYIEYIKKSYQL